MKRLMTTAAILGLLAAPAMAAGTGTSNSTMGTNSATTGTNSSGITTDTNSTMSTTPMNSQTFLSNQQGQWLASNLKGAQVQDSSGKDVGTVDGVVIGQDGNAALVIGVGSYLGIGQKDVAVSLSQFTISSASGSSSQPKLVLNTSNDQLQSAPQFDLQNMGSGSMGTSGSSNQ